jgi:hypothetical protein
VAFDSIPDRVATDAKGTDDSQSSDDDFLHGFNSGRGYRGDSSQVPLHIGEIGGEPPSGGPFSLSLI